MPILDLPELKKDLLDSPKTRQRLMGLDVGTKTIGLALSDVGRCLATPLETVKRQNLKQDVQTLHRLFTQHEIAAVVVGYPINMNGTEGPQCQFVHRFVEALLDVADIPVCLWDERLSTVAVTRTLLEADMSRRKRKGVVDKMAASYILQGALDRLQTL